MLFSFNCFYFFLPVLRLRDLRVICCFLFYIDGSVKIGLCQTELKTEFLVKKVFFFLFFVIMPERRKLPGDIYIYISFFFST